MMLGAKMILQIISPRFPVFIFFQPLSLILGQGYGFKRDANDRFKLIFQREGRLQKLQKLLFSYFILLLNTFGEVHQQPHRLRNLSCSNDSFYRTLDALFAESIADVLRAYTRTLLKASHNTSPSRKPSRLGGVRLCAAIMRSDLP